MARQHRRDLPDRLTEAGRRSDAARQELRKAERRVGLQRLAAPVDGIVQQLKVHTLGGVVTEADPLLVIVPRDRTLEAEVAILNRDAGFVAAGQVVEVKLEAFPFTRYGTVHGTLRQISQNAVEDEKQGLIYRAKVTLAQDRIQIDGRHVALAPGMAVTAEVRTGDRPVIEFLLAPLFRYQNEGMRER